MARSDEQITREWKGRLRSRVALRSDALMRLRIAEARLDDARRKNVHPREHLVQDVAHERATYNLRKRQVDDARKVLKRHKPESLRERAYQEAVACIGIMEVGGNNRGVAVERLIREGGGLAGQAWCGWFMAACYKRAGSKAVSWKWGAVRLMAAAGLLRTSSPRRGDVVRFKFDHTGMFVRDLGNGYIETIEGNTGASGAVSDSRSGGDGVYRKRRAKSLVSDYLRVPR